MRNSGRAASGAALLDLHAVVDVVHSFPTPARRRDSVDQPRRAHSHHHRRRSLACASVNPITMISPQEYASLPSSIQRKCFSSQERLQIAKRYAAEKARRRPRALRSESQSDLATPPTALEPDPGTNLKLSRRPSLPSALDDVEPLAADVSWFDSFPDKLKRLRHSKEQRSRLLSTRRLRTASRDELPLNLPSATPPPAPAVANITSSRTGTAQSPFPSPPAKPGATFTSPSNLNEKDADWLIVGPYFPRTPTTNRQIQQAPSPQSAPARSSPTAANPGSGQRSFHHSNVLRPLQLPPPTLAPIPPLPSPQILQDLSDAELSDRPLTEIPDSNADLAADVKYYHDPDARRTLRHYASPDRFDEALTLGFYPSDCSHKHSTCSSPDPPEHIRNSSPSNSEGDAASFDSQGPATPTAHEGHAMQPAVPTAGKPYADFAQPPPRQFFVDHASDDDDDGQPQYPSPDNQNMTIRMTLTRPDLRAPAEELCGGGGWQSEKPLPSPPPADDAWKSDAHDPLALDALPVCDDPSGARGAFAVHDDASARGIKRLFKSLHVRRC